jgi:hypothetical protein
MPGAKDEVDISRPAKLCEIDSADAANMLKC